MPLETRQSILIEYSILRDSTNRNDHLKSANIMPVQK